MFRQIIGQDRVVTLLKRAIESQRVAQAYLFYGNDGVGKFLTALYFGMALNCRHTGEPIPCDECGSCRKFLHLDHPDFVYLYPTINLETKENSDELKNKIQKELDAYLEKRINSPWEDYYFSKRAEIRKESVDQLQRRMELKLHEARYRICIIENADLMNQSTANALLKTLEEPPENTVIILTTEKVSDILPTIISRCQQVYFPPLSRYALENILIDRFNIDAQTARTAALIANGNFKTAFKLTSESISEARESAIDLFQMALQDQEFEFYCKVSKISKETMSSAFLDDVINYLAIMVNDMLISKYNPAAATNIDRADMIGKAATKNPLIEEHATDLLLILEDLHRKLAGHVNLQMISIKLFFALRKLINPLRKA
ncbi:MAG: DNA polymerase III subunit delta' [Candidatus Cloacimonetes bacterium]|nr:DNA polymerase III subunit delta' [Candidatus Cloacimonadota bacterium]